MATLTASNGGGGGHGHHLKFKKESNAIFEKMDADGSKSASRAEIAAFVASNAQLWAKLSVKLDQPGSVAAQVATRVAMELASGLEGDAALEAELTKEQFHDFRKHYILDPAGSEEFFQRAVFANYDRDNSGELDEEELGHFLDTIYESRRASRRLPPKRRMKRLIMKQNDVNGNKTLSFKEIRGIISGGATALVMLASSSDEDESDDDDDMDVSYATKQGSKTAARASMAAASLSESVALFEKVDADGSSSASREEIAAFVGSNAQLWSKLSIRLNQPAEVAAKVATRVAMELASGLQGQAALEAELTKEQFHQFRQKYILDPKGSEEFFQRAVFANFDRDNSGELDEEELGLYLDTIYESRRASRGLPPKDKMRRLIMRRCDKNGDKTLAFDEVRAIISGGASALAALTDSEEEQDEEDMDASAAVRQSVMHADDRRAAAARLLAALETPEEKAEKAAAKETEELLEAESESEEESEEDEEEEETEVEEAEKQELEAEEEEKKIEVARKEAEVAQAKEEEEKTIEAARKEAEEAARKETEEAALRIAKEKAARKRAQEEKARKEEEEKARKEAEEKARKEAEEKDQSYPIPTALKNLQDGSQLALKLMGSDLSQDCNQPFFALDTLIVEEGKEIWDPVYDSEPINNNQNPEWKAAGLPLYPQDVDMILRVSIYDWRTDGQHEFVGDFETSLPELFARVEECEATGKDVVFAVEDDNKNPKGNIVVKLAAIIGPGEEGRLSFKQAHQASASAATLWGKADTVAAHTAVATTAAPVSVLECSLLEWMWDMVMPPQLQQGSQGNNQLVVRRDENPCTIL